MPGLVDIHTHLLPGIDDGPTDLEGTLAMARAAVASGIGKIAATPHLRADFPGVQLEEIAERCQAVRDALAAEGIALEVVSGAEASLAWALEASEEDLRLASYGQRGTDLLIETPDHTPLQPWALTALVAQGFRIILAHPERSRAFQRQPQRLVELHEQGVRLQINADALLASRRSAVRTCAEYLCREGLADVIASDGHRGESFRPVTRLVRGLEAAAALVGQARARWMTSEAPAAVLAGTPLPEPPSIERQARSRRWFGRA